MTLTQAPPPDAAGEIVPLIMQDSEWRAAISQLFDGGFVEAGLRGEPDEWKAEFEVRTNILRAALNTPTNPLRSLSVGEEARRLLAEVISEKRLTGPSTSERVVAGVLSGASDNRSITVKKALHAIETALSQSNAAQAKLRNIISHATGGTTCDTSLPLNEIAVGITQHVNRAYEAGRTKGIEAAAKVLTARAGMHEENHCPVRAEEAEIGAATIRALSQGSGSTDGGAA